jgi:uncharacterized membrane protein
MWLFENLDWISLALRWFHVITAIAWIGSSFYFIALDYGLKRPPGIPKELLGEQWSVHGGGFYHIQKYKVAPSHMPQNLVWYKYESYFTWISGFALLAMVYYLGADSLLVDPNVNPISKETAIVTSLIFIIGGWIAYDLMCRSPIGKNPIILGAALLVFIVIAAILASSVFSGRAALLHVGVITASIMTGNVFFIIIPNQKKVVKDLLNQKQPSPHLGLQAKQRSTHNNYLTLPVVLVMISNHYPILFGHQYIWLVTLFLFVIGAIIRHFFNAHHQGLHGVQILWQWPLAFTLAIFLLAFLYHRPEISNLSHEHSVSEDQAFAIVSERCVVCHAQKPQHPDHDAPPLDIRLDNKKYLKRHADAVFSQAVLSNAMPPANETLMTEEERKQLGSWIQQLP